MELRLFRIRDDYISHLRTYDPHVMMNKSGRPYVGVVFDIGTCCYFAPLTSPKPKHAKMSNSIDFIKIARGRYGAICLNNMIPVTMDLVQPIVFKEEPPAYGRLLQNQVLWIRENTNKQKIMTSAAKLHALLLRDSGEHFNQHEQAIRRRSCNLKLLEEALLEFSRWTPAEPETPAEADHMESGTSERAEMTERNTLGGLKAGRAEQCGHPTATLHENEGEQTAPASLFQATNESTEEPLDSQSE